MTALATPVDLVVTRLTRPLDLAPADDGVEDLRNVDVLVRTVAVMHHPTYQRAAWNVLRGGQVIRCECLPAEIEAVAIEVLYGGPLIEEKIR